MLASYIVLICAFISGIAAANTTAVKIPPCALPCVLSVTTANPKILTNITEYCTDVTSKKSLVVCLLTNSTCTKEELTESYEANAGVCDGYPKEDNSTILTVVVAVLCALTIIFVGLRFYSRARIMKNIGSDDWAILAALLPGVAITIIALHTIPLGYGRHLWDVSVSNLKEMNMDLNICIILLIVTTGLTKISIVLFYLRIFPHQTFRRVCYFMIAFVTAWTVSFTFTTLFQCTPIRKAWEQELPGTCANPIIITLSQAIIGAVQDIVIILLPIPLFLKLKVSRSKRWGVVLMFGLGIISTIALICRIAYTIAWALSGDIDIPWTGVNILIWATVEYNTGIICASLPGARPFFCKLMPSVFGSLSQHEDGSEEEPKSWQPTTMSSTEEKGVSVPNRHEPRFRSAHSIIEREIAALDSSSESEEVEEVHEITVDKRTEMTAEEKVAYM